MPLCILVAASLFLAAAGAASKAPSTATQAADALPPAIEVVREGDGISGAWRREGVDFPAYGPDGTPVVPTAGQQALQALANAYDVEFLALKSVFADDHEPGTLAICTSKSACIGEYMVIREVRVQNVAQYRLARAIGDAWLRDPVDASAPCVPDYRHALNYSADGHVWRVLLSYACGQYRLIRGGVEVGEGHADEPFGQAEFDALLESAGVAAGTRGDGSAD